MPDKYWSKVAELTGMQHCPKQGPFGMGAVIGNRNGFIVAIGPAKDGNQSSTKIMVRFPNTSSGDSIRASLENSNALAVALETDRVKDKHLKNVTIGLDAILWKWEYTFAKPNAEKVANLANALVDTLKGTITDFQGKCEKCHSSSVSEILLMNELPVYFCSSCQFAVQGEIDQAARDYEAIEPNLMLGLIYGSAAALLGALAWGGIAYSIQRVFLWGAIGIGYMIAWAVIKGMGRVNVAGQVLIGVLSLLSVMAGDAFYYTLETMRLNNIPFSMDLVTEIVKNFWSIEADSKGGIMSIIFGLVGAVIAVVNKGLKPKFKVVFVPLAPDGQAKPIGFS